MNNKEKNFISAVVYIHNDENRIDKFQKMISSVLQENFEHSEIIYVNDSSTDESVKKIKEVINSLSSISVSIVNMSYFHGLETAMNAGVDMSIGDFVLEFDSVDVDYDAHEIMNCYRRSLEGYDIVSATPNKRQKISSSLFYWIMYKFNNIKMYTESFRILSRRAINRISSMNRTIPYRKIIYSNCGLKKDIIIYDVKKGNNKVIKKENKYRIGTAIDSLILFTNIGYKIALIMTIMMMFIVIFMAIYSIVIYCIGNPVAGWTTTILFMSIAFFGTFAILTIIVKYLQILVDMVFKRRRYNFESIEKLNK